MADPLKHVVSGEKFEVGARTWNKILDAARLSQLSRETGSGRPSVALHPQTTLFVKNLSGSTLADASVLAAGGPLNDLLNNHWSGQGQPIIDGTTPAAVTEQPIITLDRIEDNEIGLAVIAGVAAVLVKVNDSSHQFATILPTDSTRLQSATSGSVRILGYEADTTGLPANTKWAQVLLAVVGTQGFWVKITSGTGAGPYTGVRYHLTTGGTYAADSPTVTLTTIYRAPSNLPSPAAGSPPPDIPSNQFVWVIPSSTAAGKYETDAVGGLQNTTLTFLSDLTVACVGGGIVVTKTTTSTKFTGRDLTIE